MISAAIILAILFLVWIVIGFMCAVIAIYSTKRYWLIFSTVGMMLTVMPIVYWNRIVDRFR